MRVRPSVETDVRGTVEIIANATNGEAMDEDCSYPDFGWEGDPEQMPLTPPKKLLHHPDRGRRFGRGPRRPADGVIDAGVSSRRWQQRSVRFRCCGAG